MFTTRASCKRKLKSLQRTYTMFMFTVQLYWLDKKKIQSDYYIQ